MFKKTGKSGKLSLLLTGFVPLAIFIYIYLATDISAYSGGIAYLVASIVSNVIVFGIMILYIVDVFKKPDIARDQKMFWTVALIFGNMIAFPFYWYLHVWKQAETEDDTYKNQD